MYLSFYLLVFEIGSHYADQASLQPKPLLAQPPVCLIKNNLNKDLSMSWRGGSGTLNSHCFCKGLGLGSYDSLFQLLTSICNDSSRGPNTFSPAGLHTYVHTYK